MKLSPDCFPKSGEELIYKLRAEGYEAYFVGGCVRDLLMGKAPHDFDLAVSAAPNEMKAVFTSPKLKLIEKTTSDGKSAAEKYGTVCVVSDGRQYELTAFRSEKSSAYRDFRHPEEVDFTGSLEEDLSRRDFTINAMCAAPPEYEVIDMFGGHRDLINRTIRCIGEPEKRFHEDALRILRALRFASTLGFEIESETLTAARICMPLIAEISAERVSYELLILLGGNAASRVLSEYGDIICSIIPEAEAGKEEIQLSALTAKLCGVFESDTELKQASLLTALLSGAKEEAAVLCLTRLRLPKKLVALVKKALETFKTEKITALFSAFISGTKPDDAKCFDSMCVFMAENGARAALCAFAVSGAYVNLISDCEFEFEFESDKMCSARECIMELIGRCLKTDRCLNTASLEIDGNTLYALGLRGREIGAALNRAVISTASGKTQNTRKKILEFLQLSVPSDS